jgi:hypothetical protein
MSALPRRQIYVLKLQAEPGRDPIRGLRRLLKIAKRHCGLRALSVHEQQTADPKFLPAGQETPPGDSRQ